jgi:hypothetical protein
MIQACMQTVLGTHGRSGLFEVLIHTTAKRILHAAPGDVLLIRDQRAAGRTDDSARRGQKANPQPYQPQAKLQ